METTKLIFEILIKEELLLTDVIISRLKDIKHNLQSGNISDVDEILSYLNELKILAEKNYERKLTTKIKISIEWLELYKSLSEILEIPTLKYLQPYYAIFSVIEDLILLCNIYGNSGFIILENIINKIIEKMLCYLPKDYDPKIEEEIDKLFCLLLSKGVNLKSEFLMN